MSDLLPNLAGCVDDMTFLHSMVAKTSNHPPATFQMILYEGTNQIKCQYLDMPGPIDASGGAGATVGVQNIDHTAGLQYFFKAPDETFTMGPLESG